MRNYRLKGVVNVALGQCIRCVHIKPIGMVAYKVDKAINIWSNLTRICKDSGNSDSIMKLLQLELLQLKYFLTFDKEEKSQPH